MVKQIFPYSFKEKAGLISLLVQLLIYLVVGAIAGVLIGVLANIPIIGFIFGFICGLVDLYVTVGMVLSVLHFLGILK
jgi:hypothetical protein